MSWDSSVRLTAESVPRRTPKTPEPPEADDGMCGIAGIITEDIAVARGAIDAMGVAQKHRGPDDAGVQITLLGGVAVGLGHRRLSILDLSPAGHQPMVHSNTGDQIVYNGEIYNFQSLRAELEADGARFRGRSDTEVLLEGLVRFGSDYLDRLQGMFALAFFQPARGRLLLARDPLGIKPLYVARVDNSLLFASEIRAFLASGLVPSKMDPRGLAGLLAYGSIQEPFTFLQHVEAFPAGCWQQWDVSRLPANACASPLRYWRFPAIRWEATEEEAIAEISTVLDVAVRDHLVSDVPVGVFLSSGLDSSIVAGLAASHTSHLRTFTVGFADQPNMSESHLAAETAALFGAEHQDIQITGPSAEAAVAAWLADLDQPSADGLNTYVISKAIRAEGIVVALSGLGGDELFGGYASFARVPRLARILRAVRWLPARGRVALSNLVTLGRPGSVVQKAADIARSPGGLVDLFLHSRRMMSDQDLLALGVSADPRELTASFMPAGAFADIEVDEREPIESIAKMEARLYMGNTLLRDSDANGMAHSLEIRVPLLDRRLLDLAFALPGAVRLPSGNADKHLMRLAFAHLLRPVLTRQTKRGFTLPVGRWMAGPLRDVCEEGLSYLKSLGFLRPQGIDSVWRSFLATPDRIRYARAFILCVLGLYCRKIGL